MICKCSFLHRILCLIFFYKNKTVNLVYWLFRYRNASWNIKNYEGNYIENNMTILITIVRGRQIHTNLTMSHFIHSTDQLYISNKYKANHIRGHTIIRYNKIKVQCGHAVFGQAKQRRRQWGQVEGLMKASVSSPHSDQPPVWDQAAQAANYSNYDSLLAEINLIKRRLSRAR